MGIIARQSTKKTLVSLTGVLIGAFSIIFIYPQAKEMYGLAVFLFSFANLMMIFFSLGSLGLILKYFPVFKKLQISGFLSIISLIILGAIILTTVLLWLFGPTLYRLLEIAEYKVDLISAHQSSLYLLTIILIFCYLMINQAANLNRIVVPSVIYEFSYKIALPVLILLFIYNHIDESRFEILYLSFFGLVLIGLVVYLKFLGGLNFRRIQWKKISKSLRKEMWIYMMYSGLNRIGSTIVARVDAIMVATLISLNDTGIYGILLFMANVIDIPVRAINQISGPVISNSMEHKEYDNVAMIYRKSSVNSLVVGSFIFVLIWGLLPNIFDIMPDGNEIIPYKNVFLFLAIGKLIDMGFSTNNHILIYSKYFRYNLFFVLFLALLNLILNYVFIQIYGLIGAALASAISLAVFNLVKYLFIHIKLKFSPFTPETLKLLLIFFLLFVAVGFIPSIMMNWLDLFIKGIIISLLFYGAIKLFNVKADVVTEGENILLKIINQNIRKENSDN